MNPEPELPPLVEVLRQVARDLPSSTDVKIVLAAISRGLISHAGMAFAGVSLYCRDDECELCLAHLPEDRDQVKRLHRMSLAGAHDDPRSRAHRIPIGSLLSGRAAELRRPLVFNDLVAEYFPQQARGVVIPSEMLYNAGTEEIEWLRTNGVMAGVSIPLLIQNELVGALTVFARRPILPAEVAFLDIFAHQAAVAIRDAQLYHEAQRLRSRLERENDYLQEAVLEEGGFAGIVGKSRALLATLRQVRQVAPTDTTVLLLGETGTGKELVARAIHAQSPRHERPLVKVNCAAIAASLIESELFGHERGAFTGALQRRVGRFELADHGALFLDEVGELSAEVQAKLLRALQDGEIERVGGNKSIRVDVRLIGATNRDLEREVAEGRYRADLYYRLNVFPVRLPPLRERAEDVAPLAEHFVNLYARRLGKPLSGLSPDSLKRLQRYSWPGNIRELQNVIERACVLADGPTIRIGEGQLAPPAPAPGLSWAAGEQGLAPFVDVEKAYYRRVLEAKEWRIEGPEGAAALLRLNPGTLRSRLRKLGIRRAASAPAPAPRHRSP